jgi:hypothetical protein
LGGSGGGGAGSATSQGINGVSGTANTGGGGGAGTENYMGGSGGSGVVVIRYADTFPAATTTGSPTVTVSGGFRTYRFTGSGSIEF